MGLFMYNLVSWFGILHNYTVSARTNGLGGTSRWGELPAPHKNTAFIIGVLCSCVVVRVGSGDLCAQVKVKFAFDNLSNISLATPNDCIQRRREIT